MSITTNFLFNNSQSNTITDIGSIFAQISNINNLTSTSNTSSTVSLNWSYANLAFQLKAVGQYLLTINCTNSSNNDTAVNYYLVGLSYASNADPLFSFQTFFQGGNQFFQSATSTQTIVFNNTQLNTNYFTMIKGYGNNNYDVGIQISAIYLGQT